MKVVEDRELNENSVVLQRSTFKFENNEIKFSKDVNFDKMDGYTEHQVGETPLAVAMDNSWTESLFYGIGNKHV